MRAAVALVLLLALFLRWPVPEPAWVHVDERAFVEKPLGFLGGDPNPHFFTYPSLQLYLCAGVGYLYYAVAGGEPLDGWIAYRYFVDGFDLVVLARCVTTVMATATVAVAYCLGRRLYGPRAGLGAALFLALSPLHVRFAHLAATDAPAVLWVSLSVLWGVRVVQEGRARDCVLAGLFAGLAGATKYPAALAVVPVGAACLLRWPTWRHRGLGLAAAAALVTFAATSPYVWLDPGWFWTDFSRMGQEHLLGPLHAGGPGVRCANLRYGLGLAPLLLGLVALAWPWRWRRDEAVLLAAVAAFAALVLSASSLFLRYALPLAPLWSVLTWRLLARLDGRWRWQLACAVLVVAEPAYGSWQHRRLLSGPDTRTQAEDWLRQALPSGGRLAQLQGRPGQIGRPFTPASAMARLEPFDRSFGAQGLAQALEVLARRPDLPPLYAVFDLEALPRSTARAGAAAVDSVLVLCYEHPLRPADDEAILAPVIERVDWLASFSPGAMPEAVFDWVDWHFLPIGGWREVEATGPRIRIGRLPLAFRRPVPNSREFLELVHRVQVGRLAAQQQDWPAARQAFDAVLSSPFLLEELLTPYVRYDLFLALGAAEYELGSWPAAVTRWQQAAQLKPDRVEPYRNLALGYGALGRHDEAVGAYGRALALRGDDPDLLVGLGQSCARLGRLAEAVAAYERALALRPDAAGYADLGQLLRQRGDEGRAREAFERALRLSPPGPVAERIRGLLAP